MIRLASLCAVALLGCGVAEEPEAPRPEVPEPAGSALEEPSPAEPACPGLGNTGSTLRGRVTDLDGAPISGSRVVLTATLDGGRCVEVLGAMETDREGGFAGEVRVPGEGWTLSLEASRGDRRRRFPITADELEGSIEVAIAVLHDVELELTARCPGEAVDPGSAPRVVARVEGTPWLGQTLVRDGPERFRGRLELPTRPVDLTVSWGRCGWVFDDVPPTASRRSLALPVPDAATLELAFEGAGSPGSRTYLTRPGRGELRAIAWAPTPQRIAGLPPGRYLLRGHPSFPGRRCERAVELGGGSTQRVRLRTDRCVVAPPRPRPTRVGRQE